MKPKQRTKPGGSLLWRARPEQVALVVAEAGVFVTQELEEHLQAYRHTRNLTHFWRAWLLARASGQVNEAMLRKVDTIARRLCAADDKGGILKALEVRRPENPGKADSTADTELSDLHLIRYVWMELCRAEGTTMDPNNRPTGRMATYRSAAQQYGQPNAEAVKQRWHRFWGAHRAAKRAETHQAITAALRAQPER